MKLRNKKTIWKSLLIIGFLPFIILLLYGFYVAITGFSGICFGLCDKEYGLPAFIDFIFLVSYVYWPVYIVGIALIILSLTKLTKQQLK